jgi:LytS/YehU family sensor histidine kinase
LQAQIQPHFLFNTLNTIASFIPEQPDLAQDLMADVSEMLRRSLEGAGAHEITVSDELGLLEPYVRIQRSRFSDRLRFAITASDEARAAYLPGMMLQTLLENAVRHGVARVEGTGEVSIDVSREDGRLVSRVSDTGPGLGMPSEAALNRGIGLQNVRSRLQALYGDDYVLQFDSMEQGGLRVTISVPFHTTPAPVPAQLPRAE